MAEQDDTKEETKLTLKSLKKEFEEFKSYIDKRLPPNPLPPIHSVTPHTNPEDIAIPEIAAENEIVFHFHDRFKAPRVFCEAENGGDWRELANNFHRVNEYQIKKREDK